jgi:LysM repeat protein
MKFTAWLSRLALILLLIGGPGRIFALETGGMGIAPAHPDPNNPVSRSWFLYNVDPGQVIQDAAEVQNTGTAPVTLKVEGLDAFLLDDGAFALTDSEDTNKEVGTWIALSEKRVTLQPGERKEIPFTLTVPKDAEVGDHVAGLAVYRDTDTPETTFQSGGASVGISTRVGARIYLTVKGDIKRDLKVIQKRLLRINDQLVLRLKFKNDGNIRASLQADTTIYSLFGVYDKQKVDIGQVLPHKTLTRDTVWPGKKGFMFGPYLAHVILTDTVAHEGIGPMKPISLWLPAFFVPPTQTAVLLLLIFLVWFIIRLTKWLKLSRLAKRPVVEHEFQNGESLYGLAASHGVDWKLVATLNHIKPPYYVEPGTLIFIPDNSGEIRRDIKIPSLLGALLPFGRKTKKIKELKPTPSKTSKPKIKYTTLVADEGDTLKDIAEFAGITTAELAKLNGIAKPSSHKVQEGDELIVPENN